ncbi:DUF2066 domain-containing protein [Mesorhizobium sp. M2D.F.Ca.ET.185.01.1.1]|uniref:DUF2066 domain-containing protein n=1 Tax=unclassified Mesorhizobium TaxID=325217 RepID=UPI000FCBCCB2|nr:MULTISPECIES: DUF2066 domain-containing protein [unclassified Mesorhizobium]TGP79093.1 DUF2066 domain-containing protein [bacterium M00.F.Ca.ET.227.01.1.1]TGP89379.1 DUF2066 domain-containing protein [bacterium M00.F.Ca.ET.221.01.1.1]TGP94751.1 DUF2066 domain-containing protein [bacterium M00.F.Ca.ET.222.01.1.1]TGU03533.1 DUF2066 domain-containing protein [bacterium M00.F.Ca.ET.163.01.1.1]TGU28375.1 DUF2066 domain-containing protein [bacterium M00.F.Ca.ET.156.01.1.1]TGU45735.1 DUF2066 doma
MRGISRLAAGLVGLLCLGAATAFAATPAELYQAQAIVTGTGDVNRQIGFRECLDKVLVKVSGDQRLTQKPEILALRDKAADFVQSFRYHDRLEGIPIHDEQGTHDRPHDLTCLYKPAVVDKLLAQLGSRPWLGERPLIAVFMTAEQGSRHFVLTDDEDQGKTMRESFANATAPLLMRIAFPKAKQLGGLDEKTFANADMARLDQLAKKAGAARALAGSIVWSDKELGWIADWRLANRGKTYRWQVRGVSFDEAFRVAMRGAAQILSGNGQP